MRTFVSMALIAWISFSSVGCQVFNSDKKSKKDSWFSFGKKNYQVPHSMAVIWSEDVLSLPGKPATRGFGGRIYFYNDRSQAIPVDGELTVYGWDESKASLQADPQTAADKKFKFTAEQFTEHFSESELGASYSVWIPWEAEGGFRKKISLVATFVSKDGKLVRSEPSPVFLPGRDPNLAAQKPAPNSSPFSEVRQASHDHAISAPRTSGLRTTTIQIPTGQSSLLNSYNSAARPTDHSLVSANDQAPTMTNEQFNAMQTAFSQSMPMQSLPLQAMQQSLPNQNMVAPNPTTQTAQPSFEKVVPQWAQQRQSTLSNFRNRADYTEVSMPSGPMQQVLPQQHAVQQAHFEPSQYQVQAAQGVQPSAYLPR